MGFLSNFIEGESSAIFSKQEEAIEESWSGKMSEAPRTAPAYQDINYKRIPRKNLDWCYINDAQVFGSINRRVQKIMKAGYRIEAEKKKDQEIWDGFFESICKIGQPFDLDEIHEKNFFDKLKYGTTYIELLFNDNYTKIVDIKPLDARVMDYARDTNKNIYFNPKTQKPLGYAIKVDIANGREMYGDEIPEWANISLESDEIFVYAFRIVEFPLFNFGNNWESIGVIETVYNTKERKDKIVEAITNELYIAGSNPIYAVLGDNQKKPSKQQKKKTLEALQNMRHSSAIVFEHPTTINTIDVKHSDQYNDILKYLKSDISTSIGMPLSLLDSTDDIPRSALKQMKEDMDLSEQHIVETYVRQFNKRLLDVIAKVNNWGKAKLIWNDVASEDIDSKVDNLLACVDKRIFSPEQVFDELKNILNVHADIKDIPKEEVEPVKENKDNNIKKTNKTQDLEPKEN